MDKLIISAITYLKKKILFWFFMIGFFVYGIFMALVGVYENVVGTITLDGCIFGFVPVMGVAAAIFVGSFIGNEYIDGAMRNKLIVGHTRTEIYLSNLIVCAIANVIFACSYIFAVIIVGGLKRGTLVSEFTQITFLIICSFLIVIAMVSIMTLLAMLNSNKAVNAIASLILAIVLLMSSSYIYRQLCEPEQYESYVSVDSNGIPTEIQSLPNPQYIDGTRRNVFIILNNCLPFGQAVQLADMFDSEGKDNSYEFTHISEWPFYSTITIVVFNVIGIISFEKKQIK